MLKITILGSGNVAQHLIAAFAKSTAVEIIQVYARSKESIPVIPGLYSVTDDFSELEEADLYILAVSDNAIAEVSSKLPFKNKLVAHTSGAAAVETLDQDNRRAVFYPLQTFTKNKEIDFENVPICLETEFPYDYITLDTVAKAISGKVFTINSMQRKSLHVSAVFVNNFVNHLYEIGNRICLENQVPFEILKPLISETASKIMALSPQDAQTGPAKRNDTDTIGAHLAFLSDESQKNIYRILTQSIQENGKKL